MKPTTEVNPIMNLLCGVVPSNKKDFAREDISEMNRLIMEAGKKVLEEHGYNVNMVLLDKAAAVHLQDYNRERAIKWNESRALRDFINDADNISNAKLHAVYLKEYVMDRVGEYFSLSDVVENCDAKNFVVILNKAGLGERDMSPFKAVRKFLLVLQAFNFVAMKTDGKRDLYTVTMEKADLLTHVDSVIATKENDLKNAKLIRAAIKKESERDKKREEKCRQIAKEVFARNADVVKDFRALSGAIKLTAETNMGISVKNTQISDFLMTEAWPLFEKEGLLKIDAIRVIWDGLVAGASEDEPKANMTVVAAG